jgi:hypothetical protein
MERYNITTYTFQSNLPFSVTLFDNTTQFYKKKQRPFFKRMDNKRGKKFSHWFEKKSDHDRNDDFVVNKKRKLCQLDGDINKPDVSKPESKPNPFSIPFPNPFPNPFSNPFPNPFSNTINLNKDNIKLDITFNKKTLYILILIAIIISLLFNIFAGLYKSDSNFCLTYYAPKLLK